MIPLTHRLSRIAVALASAFLVTEARAATIYGVAVQGQTQSLVTWDSSAPGTILSSLPITNLPAGETIRGIDFDPVYFPGNLRLFAIGTGNDGFINVYRILVGNGFASKLPPGSSPRADPVGAFYGVSSSGSNSLRSVDDSARWSGYSTNTNSGAVQAELIYAPGDAHAGQAPHLVHLLDGFAIDSTFDTLATFGPGSGNPQSMSTIGPLGLDVDDEGGIDRDDFTNTVYAALLPTGQTQSNLYTLNLQNGALALIGPIGQGLQITAMAVEPPVILPETSSAILCLMSVYALRLSVPPSGGSARR